MDLNNIINKAKTSSFQLKLLNVGLNKMIPFNRPHGFKIMTLSDESIKTYLPYKKKNLNHLKGLHAGALATLCEFTTGVFILSKMDLSKYRIILKKLDVEYHYQGKSDAIATFGVTDEWINDHVVKPLETNDAVEINCKVEIHDNNRNHLATSIVNWQLKDWEKVRTKPD